MSGLGIIAGGGALPRRLLEAARAQGYDPFVVALVGQTDEGTVQGVRHAWFRLGEIPAAIDRLREENIVDLVMIGPVARPSLSEVMPNPRVFKFLKKAAFKAMGDDGLLQSLIKILEQDEGFRVRGTAEFLSEQLAREGQYGAHCPDDQASRDVQRGLAVVHALGNLDIGQAVVVQQGLVLGVEALEGTDALLERCGPLKRDGAGGVLVKARKPGQDDRVDLPTVGPGTLDLAVKAGLRGIAVEAGTTLVADEALLVAKADEAGLFVVGLRIED